MLTHEKECWIYGWTNYRASDGSLDQDGQEGVYSLTKPLLCAQRFSLFQAHMNLAGDRYFFLYWFTVQKKKKWRTRFCKLTVRASWRGKQTRICMFTFILIGEYPQPLVDPFVLWHQQYPLVYRRKSVNPITHQPKYNCLKATAARGILVRFFFIFFFFFNAYGFVQELSYYHVDTGSSQMVNWFLLSFTM